jgi:hypothetical protein
MSQRVVNMLPNPRNNSNILLGEKQHIIFVDSNDADKIREYTDALGTSSLHDSLSIISSTDTSVSEKGKAIGDLILLRHILSGEIQFKEKRLFTLFQTAIGKKFINISKYIKRYSDLYFNNKVKELIMDLDNNEKDISVIARPLLEFMRSIVLTSMPISPMVGIGNAYVFFALFAILVPIVTARVLNEVEDKVYTIALVKLIDRFLSTNEDIHEIINNPESGAIVPEPLRNDPLGMALYFKYIKQINIKNEQYAKATGLQRKRRNIEKQTGTNVLNMNTFTALNKSLDDCGICLKPLASAVMGKPIEICENHHMFHGICIVKWILNSGSGEKLCPTCRQPISDDTIRQLFQDKNVLDHTIEERFINNPGFGGGRKRWTLRYKKRKSTRKNMRRK